MLQAPSPTPTGGEASRSVFLRKLSPLSLEFCLIFQLFFAGVSENGVLQRPFQCGWGGEICLLTRDNLEPDCRKIPFLEVRKNLFYSPALTEHYITDLIAEMFVFEIQNAVKVNLHKSTFNPLEWNFFILKSFHALLSRTSPELGRNPLGLTKLKITHKNNQYFQLFSVRNPSFRFTQIDISPYKRIWGCFSSQ